MSPEAKIRPPQPKKKQKRVTFIEQPTIVTCDGMDELAAAHRREVETMQMLSTSQVSHGQKQTIVQKQATTYGDEATIIGVEASQAKSGAPICLQEGNTSAKPVALPTMSKVQTTDLIGTTVCMEQEQMHTVKQSGAHLLATNQPGVASQCKPEATKLQNQLRVSPQQAAPNPQQEQMHTVKQPVRDLLATKQPNVATQVKLKASNLQKQHRLSPQQAAPNTSRQPLGDLNGRCQQGTKVHEGGSAEAFGNLQTKQSPIAIANKENKPEGMSKAELAEAARIDNLIARCMAPSNKFDESNLHCNLGSAISKTARQQTEMLRGPSLCDAPHQTQLQEPSDFCIDYCPAPTFNIGLEEIFGPSIEKEVQVPAATGDDCLPPNGSHVAPINIVDETLELNLSQQINSSNLQMYTEARGKTPIVVEIPDDDFNWDLEEIDLACEEAERMSQDRLVDLTKDNLSPTNFSTPDRSCYKGGEVGSSSSSGEITNKFQRRIIKPTACKRSPFVDYNEKKNFHCSPAVNRLYSSVILHARLSEEETGDEDRSPTIIDYDGYYVSLRELAESMKKHGFVKTHVFELIIESIMRNLPPNSKKIIMPVRFLIRLQQMIWNTQEIRNRFNKKNRLDRKDMIMLPILENLDSAKPVTDNHYWLFTVNIRDRKFEVLDSWRSLQDSKTLDDNARLIAATVRSLWDEEYPNSRVKLENFRLENIDVPKQDNDCDCGIFTVTLANLWEARVVPSFGPSNITNIRRIIKDALVNNENNKAPWRDILKLSA